MPGQLVGKSPYLQAVQVEAGRRQIGDIVPVRIIRAGSNSLVGEAADAAGADGGGVIAESAI